MELKFLDGGKLVALPKQIAGSALISAANTVYRVECHF
jgi:hypothetical protein